MHVDFTAALPSETTALAPTSPDAALPAPVSPAASDPSDSQALAVASPVFDDDPLGDEIAELSAHIDAAIYRLLTLIRRYDEEGRWHQQGFRTCAHWLSWRTGLSLGPARERIRVARCLPSLPHISTALAKGQLSYSKVRAMTRMATAENEEQLLIFATHGTTAHVERLVRERRRMLAGDDPSAAERAARRGLSVYVTDDGDYEIRGRLAPEVGALLLKAIEVTEDKLYKEQRAAGTEHETTAAGRRADAFGLWLEERVQPTVQLVLHSVDTSGPVDTSGLVVTPGSIDTPCPVVTEEGAGVPAGTSERLCCDAEVVPVTRGADGSVLDVGRRRRTVDWRLRKALEARDGGCRFPGCDSRLRTHAHHIRHWARGGETALDNLVLLCPFHHRTVHEGGWRVEMDERGVPRFFNPLGVQMPEAPEAPEIGGLLPPGEVLAGAVGAPAAAADAPPLPPPDFGLARWHGEDGIGPWTGTTLWQGETPDLNWALDWFAWKDGDDRVEGR